MIISPKQMCFDRQSHIISQYPPKQTAYGPLFFGDQERDSVLAEERVPQEELHKEIHLWPLTEVPATTVKSCKTQM